MIRITSRKAIAGLILLAALAMPGPARGLAWLAPGEPLLEAHLAALVEPALPASETFQLSFTHPALPLSNPASSEAHLQLLELRQDPRTERFTGAFLVRLASGEERAIGFAGEARAMVEVPVPLRTIAAGEQLEPTLLELTLLPERQLRTDTMLDPTELTGLETRRRLLPGRPVRRRDVQERQLVRRGEPVDVVYRAPGIEVTVTARALEHGSRGSLVTATNLESGKRLTGVVTGAGQITLGTRRELSR
jgi:flagella basal body P-ring formation protein FlgA